MEKLSRKEREKLRREREIIDAAESSFLEQGFDGTSMDTVAEKAEFTKRTVYQYFLNKEELFLAVVLRSYELLNTYVRKASEEGSTVLEKLENGCRGFYRFHRNHPGRVALITAVGPVKNRLKGSRYMERFNELDMSLFHSIEEMIGKGQQEGSIAPLYDAKMEACTITFMITAFFNLLSVAGRTFIEHCGLDEDAFIEAAVRILVDHLKP